MQPLSIAVLAVSLLFVPSLQAAEFEQPGETVRGELQGVAEPEGAECSGVGWPVNYWPEPGEAGRPPRRPVRSWPVCSANCWSRSRQ